MYKIIGSIAVLIAGLLSPALGQRDFTDIDDWPTAGNNRTYGVTGVYLAEITVATPGGFHKSPGLVEVNSDGCVELLASMADITQGNLGRYGNVTGVWKQVPKGYRFRLMHVYPFSPHGVVRVTADLSFNKGHTKGTGELVFEIFGNSQILDPPDPQVSAEPLRTLEATVELARVIAD